MTRMLRGLAIVLRWGGAALFGLLWLSGIGCGGGGGGSAKPVTVAILPTTAAVPPGGSQSFTATVANTTNQAITWRVQEGATGGAITAAGVYTAPQTAGTYHVIATSSAAGNHSATATITVSVAVTIAPMSATLGRGQSVALTANVAGSTNQAVTWSVQEGATGGAITAAGVYTAPQTPGTYHVVATSQADTTQTATATITVADGSSTVTVK